MKTVSTVIGGPDMFKMSVALCYGSNKEQVPVTFTLEATDRGTRHEWKEHIKIDSMEREDGSGRVTGRADV